MRSDGGAHMKKELTVCAAALLLTACGDTSSAPQEMQYIKTSVTYNTIYDMYINSESYLGGLYHIVGTLYPSTDEDGETFYSVYAKSPDGEGIGLELDWNDFSGIDDYDTITVEGTLDLEKGTHDGAEIEYLILRCTMVEKRET